MTADVSQPDRRPNVGVLAMQGAFAEHVRALHECGVDACEVRTRAQLEHVDAIVIPGGESTAIRKALDRCDLLDPLRARIAAGMPALGTCAGMIVLANESPGPADATDAPPCFGLLDIDVDRNGFGRQSHSAERAVQTGRGTLPGVFIRAPRITRVGDGVEVLGTIDGGEPVIVRQGLILAASFHPELTADRTLHDWFVDVVRSTVRAAA